MVNSNAYPSKLLDFIDKKNSQGSNLLFTSHPSKSRLQRKKNTQVDIRLPNSNIQKDNVSSIFKTLKYM